MGYFGDLDPEFYENDPDAITIAPTALHLITTVDQETEQLGLVLRIESENLGVFHCGLPHDMALGVRYNLARLLDADQEELEQLRGVLLDERRRRREGRE